MVVGGDLVIWETESNPPNHPNGGLSAAAWIMSLDANGFRGAVLLTAGTKGKRNALPHARVVIHQPLAGTEGATTEILLHLKEFQRLKKDLNDILLRHTGQTLERVERDTDRDKFMSPREAMEYGIVDNVLERLPAALTPRPQQS